MLKKLLAIIVLVMALSVAGCIQTQNPSPGSSQVNAYANAFVNSTKANLGPGETLVSSNVVQNGSDAMQVTMTVTNTTPTSIWSNGSQYTYALNVKQFDNTNDASSFYNSTTFGYNQGNSSSVSISNTTNVYQQVRGHTPTIDRYSTQETSLSLLGGSINVAIQQDEFVTYGAVAVVPGASGSATPTPAPTVAPTSTPTVTPSPTPVPTSPPITLSISGPTTMVEGGGGVWIVYINGQLPTAQQSTQIVWNSGGLPGMANIPGYPALGPSGPYGSWAIDANGAANTYPGTYTLTTTYMGASASFTVTRLPNPTITPTATATIQLI
jgi:hypothetical protein